MSLNARKKRFSESDSCSEFIPSPSPDSLDAEVFLNGREVSSPDTCLHSGSPLPEGVTTSTPTSNAETPSKCQSYHCKHKPVTTSATPVHSTQVPRSRVTLLCHGNEVTTRCEQVFPSQKESPPKDSRKSEQNFHPREHSEQTSCDLEPSVSVRDKAKTSRVRSSPPAHSLTDFITGQSFFLKEQNRTDVDNPVEVRVYELQDPDPVAHVYLKAGLQQGGHLLKKSKEIHNQKERALKPSLISVDDIPPYQPLSETPADHGTVPFQLTQSIQQDIPLHPSPHAVTNCHYSCDPSCQSSPEDYKTCDTHLTAAPPANNTQSFPECTCELSALPPALPSAPSTEETDTPFGPDTMASLSQAINPLVPGASSSGGPGRVHEKENLQELNTRLSMYITHVRQIRENAHRVDSSAFLESIKILEDELMNLKDIYEKELDNTRNEAEELKKMRNQLSMEINKMNAMASDLENKLTTEKEKNEKCQQEIEVLRRELMNKDQDYQNATHAIKKPLEDLEKLRSDHEALIRENENVKRRYEKEQLQRQEAQDANHQTEQKLQFQKQVHEEEVKDLNDRLQVASNTILELESRIREYAIADTSLQEMMQRVRTAAENELKRYQEESAAAFNQSLTELKSQLDTSSDKIQMLTEENERLHEELGNAMAHSRELETQVAGMICQRNAIEDLLNQERLRARDNVQQLERKLHSLQDLLVAKMREVNNARESSIPLRNEIEAFKTLIEEEERRLHLPPTFHPEAAPGAPVLASSTSVANNVNSLHNGPSGRVYSGMLSATTPGVTHPALGPVRARSAPAPRQKDVTLVPTSLGQGRDYFDELFKDLRIHPDLKKAPTPPQNPPSNQRPQAHIQPLPDPPSPLPEMPSVSESPVFTKETPKEIPPMDKPQTVNTHDYTTSTSSATGDVQIMEVHPQGKYIRLHNTSNKDDELGGHMIVQNVGGHPVALFRFPPWVRFPANATVTVWAGCNDPLLHQPPTDFVFKEQQKWGTGPECTTILCKPNNQAIAWLTAAHRFTPDAYQDNHSHESPLSGKDQGQPPIAMATDPAQDFQEYNMDVNAKKPKPVYLRREKENPPSLNPPKHPHGNAPPAPVHPATGQARSLTYGNDNSSVNRQSRVQSTPPAPIPGAPYAGASAQRMGSASLRKPPSTLSNNASGAIANRAASMMRSSLALFQADLRGTETSPPPSSFQKPHARFQTGLEQVQSQHNMHFQPPMPRPPLFAAW